MKINIGPRRGIPLCVAAVRYPGFLEILRKGRIPGTMHFEENVQPTIFFIRIGVEASDLGEFEQKLFDRITEFPTSQTTFFGKCRKRLIHAIGFTPTDTLHVLGIYILGCRSFKSGSKTP